MLYIDKRLNTHGTDNTVFFFWDRVPLCDPAGLWALTSWVLGLGNSSMSHYAQFLVLWVPGRLNPWMWNSWSRNTEITENICTPSSLIWRCDLKKWSGWKPLLIGTFLKCTPNSMKPFATDCKPYLFARADLWVFVLHPFCYTHFTETVKTFSTDTSLHRPRASSCRVLLIPIGRSFSYVTVFSAQLSLLLTFVLYGESRSGGTSKNQAERGAQRRDPGNDTWFWTRAPVFLGHCHAPAWFGYSHSQTL